MDTSDIIAIGSLIVAILSIVTTIILTVFNAKHVSKLNDSNVKANYYSKIFDEYLIEKIPKSRGYIRFDGEGKLQDVNELCACLTNLRNSSLYFKYSDEEFYKQIKNHTMELEDFLANKASVKHESEEMEETEDGE